MLGWRSSSLTRTFFPVAAGSLHSLVRPPGEPLTSE